MSDNGRHSAARAAASLLSIGLDTGSTPLALRERLVFPRETLADGLALEKLAAHYANQSVSQADIGARREQVTSRGSEQTKVS